MTTDDAGGTQNNALQIEPRLRLDHIHFVIGSRKLFEMTALRSDARKINMRLVRFPSLCNSFYGIKSQIRACKHNALSMGRLSSIPEADHHFASFCHADRKRSR